jgi:uncharacterized protein (TIGR03067 family)
MREGLLLGVALGLGMIPDMSPDKTVEQEQDRLQGIWMLIAVEIQGEKFTEDRVQPVVKLKIEGDRFTLQIAEFREAEGTGRLDPTTKPKTLDVQGKYRLRASKLGLEGIYDLQEDLLKVCLNLQEGKGRPAEFRTQLGEETVLAVFQRKKNCPLEP